MPERETDMDRRGFLRWATVAGWVARPASRVLPSANDEEDDLAVVDGIRARTYRPIGTIPRTTELQVYVDQLSDGRAYLQVSSWEPEPKDREDDGIVDAGVARFPYVHTLGLTPYRTALMPWGVTEGGCSLYFRFAEAVRLTVYHQARRSGDHIVLVEDAPSPWRPVSTGRGRPRPSGA